MRDRNCADHGRETLKQDLEHESIALSTDSERLDLQFLISNGISHCNPLSLKINGLLLHNDVNWSKSNKYYDEDSSGIFDRWKKPLKETENHSNAAVHYFENIYLHTSELKPSPDKNLSFIKIDRNIINEHKKNNHTLHQKEILKSQEYQVKIQDYILEIKKHIAPAHTNNALVIANISILKNLGELPFISHHKN